MRYLFCVFIFSLIIAAPVMYAATDSFTVSTLVGEDTQPPTTPSILEVNPVAPTQIDVTWSTSTDNFSLSGYRLFRGGLQIATTTLNSFSDTGLTPGVTYTYTVNAFDSAGNTSSTSLPAATTTPALPSTTTPPQAEAEESPSTAGSGRIVLDSLSITTSNRSVTFEFSTKLPARYTLRWGRTSSYDGGYISSDIFRRNHLTVIPGLEPGTVYEYELIGYNNIVGFPLSRGQFTTEQIPDVDAPPNVRNLRATVVGEDVILSWENPSVEDFHEVRIMRSHYFHPLDPRDGYFRYQGEAEEFFDRGALNAQHEQFYTVFAYDKNGNISSGAVVRATVSGESGGSSAGDQPAIPSSPISDEPVSEPDPEAPDEQAAETLRLTADQVDLTQGTRTFRLSDRDIAFSDTAPITVGIGYEYLPERLKSIILDVYAPGGELVHAYLMRINKDQSAYEATIPEVGIEGEATFVVQVYDLEVRNVSEVRGSAVITSKVRERETVGGSIVPSDYIDLMNRFWWVLIAASLLVLLVLIRSVLRRRA